METNAFNIKKGWASNLFCFLTLFAVLNIFFLINVDLLFDLQNSVFLNLAIVLGGLHAIVTRGVGWGACSLIWPIRGCAAGQTTVREQNLDTLDTN